MHEERRGDNDKAVGEEDAPVGEGVAGDDHIS
jgi:hypothetical protein